MANIIQEAPPGEDAAFGGMGDDSMMMDADDDGVMALDDIEPCQSSEGCQTTTECEEDRKLLEAFLNETDIDLIENDDFDGNLSSSGGGVVVGVGASNNRNIRQVSDGTNATTATNATDNNSVVPSSEAVATAVPPRLTGRPPIQLYLSCNPDHLSEYQCLMRKNIELFEAQPIDVQSRIKGRNKPIVLGQVGIRCMHCRMVLPEQRGRGAMYYPHKLSGIYQAAQILSQGHLLSPNNICGYVPAALREELARLKAIKSDMTTAGKDYWAVTARALGVYEDEYGLRFEERLGVFKHGHNPTKVHQDYKVF